MQTLRRSDHHSLTLHRGVIRTKTAKVCTSSENVSQIARVCERHGCFSCLLTVSCTHQMEGCRFKVADAVKMGDRDGPQSSACGYTGAFCFVSLVRMLISTPLSFSFPFFASSISDVELSFQPLINFFQRYLRIATEQKISIHRGGRLLA